MGNEFISVQEIARQALPILKENLVFPLLSYVECSQDFSKKGDTVQVKKPPVYVANEFSGEIVRQEVHEDKVLVTLDKIADVSVELGAKEMALNLQDFTSQVLTPAVTAIAEKINRDGMQLYQDIPYYCGTAGTTPDDLSDFANAVKVLNQNKAPVSERSAVWDYEALSKLQVIPAVVNAEKTGSTKALRDGSIGRILGMDNFMSQAVPSHTAGVLTGTAKAKAQTLKGSKEIVLAADSLTGSVKKGDLIVIAGDSYVITEDATAASNEIEVSVYPALRKKIETTDTVTLVGDHTANLAFHRNAFGFVTRPLEAARGAESYVINFEGLTLRVTIDYDIASKKQIMSVDTLYGFKTLYPELACRILG